MRWRLLVCTVWMAGSAHADPVIHWQNPTLNIDQTPLTDLDLIGIYWGIAPGEYSHRAYVNPAAHAAGYDLRLRQGTYYIAATAINEEGDESAFSNEITRTVDQDPVRGVQPCANGRFLSVCPPTVDAEYGGSTTNSLTLNYSVGKQGGTAYVYVSTSQFPPDFLDLLNGTGATYHTIINSVRKSANPFTATGLLAGQTYYVHSSYQWEGRWTEIATQGPYQTAAE